MTFSLSNPSPVMSFSTLFNPRLYAQTSMVWFTGLSGSGKSTLEWQIFEVTDL